MSDEELARLVQTVGKRLYGLAARVMRRCSHTPDVRVEFSDTWSFVVHLLTLPGSTDTDKVLVRICQDGHYAVGNLQFVTRVKAVKTWQKPARRRKTYKRVFQGYGVYRS